MASAVHVKEYTRWINQSYEKDVERNAATIATANEGRRLDLLASALRSLADGYHMRGAVRVYRGDQQGWHDIQAGYLAKSYCLQIAEKLNTGWLNLIKDNNDFSVETIAHLGLARLLSRSFDVEKIVKAMDPRFDMATLLGRSKAGKVILPALFKGTAPQEINQLKNDRIACCRARSSSPERITEFPPFGILDIEMAIHRPESAEFAYPELEYTPTLDENLSLAIDIYYRWLG